MVRLWDWEGGESNVMRSIEMIKICDFVIWFFFIFYIMVFVVCGKEVYGKGYLYE